MGPARTSSQMRDLPRKGDDGRYGDVDEDHHQRRIILVPAWRLSTEFAYLYLDRSIKTVLQHRATPQGIHFSRLSSSIRSPPVATNAWT
jgi:hypothetical protein